MATITLRVNEQENKLIKDYVKINNYNLSSFIRDVVLDRIEDDKLVIFLFDIGYRKEVYK